MISDRETRAGYRIALYLLAMGVLAALGACSRNEPMAPAVDPCIRVESLYVDGKLITLTAYYTPPRCPGVKPYARAHEKATLDGVRHTAVPECAP